MDKLNNIKLHNFFFIVSIVFCFSFLVLCGFDYYRYNTSYWGSAPYYVFVLVRAIEILVPAFFSLIVAIILKIKYKKNIKKEGI